eukprot:sb/3475601/
MEDRECIIETENVLFDQKTWGGPCVRDIQILHNEFKKKTVKVLSHSQLLGSGSVTTTPYIVFTSCFVQTKGGSNKASLQDVCFLFQKRKVICTKQEKGPFLYNIERSADLLFLQLSQFRQSIRRV